MLILGSFCGLIPFSNYLVIIVIRILNGERVLAKGHIEYREYKKIKYRLIPFIMQHGISLKRKSK